uniref:NADH dehydrogenase subunit 6 n=1 Tax=Acosmeryx castanea TaxID=1086104 RepID=UPI0021FAE32B|nr:NADH dehydrogenase subunit 6 [Acosmeryx castanea]UXR12372.1 NADH dehydrogenase subunit 6 [Acosmeryx castanea]WMQ52793.1 NADH dehydrogenase subunit 6 [Acosmeryx castanea]WMQ78068.1 NADH dehydrogenase subunit 6 [Acosmeryx castanea]
MMKMTLSMFICMLSMMMYSLTHPLSMGMLILIQTLLTCLLSGMLIKTYWFSYILFLTFLGGLLVLFIYVSSIASNEMFSFSNNNKIMFIMTLTMILMIQFFFNKNLNWMNLINNSEMNNFMNFMFFNNENKINLNKLYNNNSSMLMSLLIIYLFITLIAIVKITNIFFGPLRMFFN